MGEINLRYKQVTSRFCIYEYIPPVYTPEKEKLFFYWNLRLMIFILKKLFLLMNCFIIFKSMSAV